MGGVGGTVIVDKAMIIAGDLYVGKDLLVMGQIGVTGTIDLGSKEILEVGGEEPIFPESTATRLSMPYQKPLHW